MSWPEASDYQDAIQSAQLCFVDSGLRRGSVALTQHGLPRPMSGNFACVFEVRNGVSRWAVKCFLRQVAGQEKRYAALSQQLVGMRLPCLVGFEYLPQGILVKGQWYPIVKMEWSAGEALHLYVERHLNDGKTLLNLAAQWRGLVNSLRGYGIAHGDLQHDNVQVATNGQIELVDYDAMYVPALRGDVSPELGHSNFQHPKRKPSDFDASLDNFAALVVYTSLRALAVDPGLWRQYHTDVNLIFRQQDFVAPTNSPAFRSLANSQDRGVRLLAEALTKCCMGSITQVPALETVVGSYTPPIPAIAPVLKQTQNVLPTIRKKGGLSNYIFPVLIVIPIALYFIGFFIPKSGGETPKGNPEVTVNLQNNGCTSQDFYLNGKLITTIPAESSQSFSVTAGRYKAKACTPHTNNCGSVASVDWRPGTKNVFTLSRHPNCRNVVTPQPDFNGVPNKSSGAGQAPPPTMNSASIVLGMGKSQNGFERNGSTGYVYWHGRLLDDKCPSEKRYVLLSSPANRYVAGFCSLTGTPDISPSLLLDNQSQKVAYSGFRCMFGNGTPHYSWLSEDILGSATCHINVADLMKHQSGGKTPKGNPEVTVNLQNNGCSSQDFYLSGQLIATIPAESSQSFSVTAGRYEAKVCASNTNNCGRVVSKNLKPGTKNVFTLSRHPNCKNVVKPQSNPNGENYGNSAGLPRAYPPAPPTTTRSTPPVAHKQSPPALSSFTVTIRSTPPGAIIYLDRNRVGITPFTTTLGKGIYGIKIEKEGYQRKIGQIEDGQQDFHVELSPE